MEINAAVALAWSHSPDPKSRSTSDESGLLFGEPRRWTDDVHPFVARATSAMGQLMEGACR